jgi:UDP-2,3-diacylglucosamine hydrolase
MLETLNLTNKKVFFASDMHLGAPDKESSNLREKNVVRWLTEIQHEAEAIVLVGDIFDFWYEYKKVVPRGYVRLLGKLAELSDAGIQIIFFTGNHDIWMFRYFQEELKAKVYTEPQVIEANGMRIMVGHGDGLGKGDYFYKLLKKVFTNPFCIWAFGRLHPNFAFGLAHSWSQKSRLTGITSFDKETDYLYNYCVSIEEKEHHDYYIFGHRHFPIKIPLNSTSTYINIGEWVTNAHYGVLDANGVELLKY